MPVIYYYIIIIGAYNTYSHVWVCVRVPGRLLVISGYSLTRRKTNQYHSWKIIPPKTTRFPIVHVIQNIVVKRGPLTGDRGGGGLTVLAPVLLLHTSGLLFSVGIGG